MKTLGHFRSLMKRSYENPTTSLTVTEHTPPTPLPCQTASEIAHLLSKVFTVVLGVLAQAIVNKEKQQTGRQTDKEEAKPLLFADYRFESTDSRL